MHIKQILLSTLLLILLSTGSHAQTYINLLAGTPYEEESFKNIEIDPSGNIWAIVGGYKILKIAPNGTYTAYYNNSGNNNMPWHFWAGLEDLAIGPNGNVWLTNYAGFSQNTSGLRAFSPNFTLLGASTNLFDVNRIKFDQLGNLWMHGFKKNPTDEAIFKLPAADVANGSIEQSHLVEYDDDNSPLPYDQYLNTMALESPNTMWFGTQYDGVFKFDGSTWTQVIDDNFAPVNKLLFDKSNNLLIGTSTSGIIIRKPNGDLLQYTSANSELFSTDVDVLCVDNEGVVWLGSYNSGLCRMTNLNAPVQVQLPLLHQRVYDIARDHSGNIFVATLHGLLKFAAPPPTLLYPKLTLSAFERQPGQTLGIMGSDFTPSGAIKIVLTAPGTSSPQEILTTGASNGTFTYPFTAPSTPGTYTVKAIDLSNAKETLLKTFQVLSPAPPPMDYLQIIAPSATDIFFIEGPNAGFIPVSYSDKMFLAGNTYPLSGAYRLYRYKIEYSLNNGPWQYAGEQSGQHLVSQTLNATFQMSMPGASGQCKVRITDLYNTSRTKTGPVFTLQTLAANALKVDFSWDYSYQTNKGKPIGAAADGVGRFYLGVSKPGASLQSVSVSLSDDQGTTTPSKLGKVMAANITEYFSNEANLASGISAASTTLDALGTCWFWYVSPEDFTRNLGDFTAKERTVFLSVSATFSNGLMENILVPIKVVRPPLVLAHGLGGDPSTWDKFKSVNGDLVKDDPRFVVAPVAVSMLPTGFFEANAQLILGLLASQVRAIRVSGYACNQLDYVCHSMGGSVMRYCLSDSINGSANPLFKVFYDPTRSYGKGLTHKIITLDTPHNGSPFADLLVRYKQDAIIRWFANYGGFFINNKPTPAILNLQIDPGAENEGGINFSKTAAATKAHLIASEINCDSTSLILNGVLWSALYSAYEATALPNEVPDCDERREMLTDLHYEPGFIDASDLIVSTQSQLAGDPVFSTTGNKTVFQGLTHTPDLGPAITNTNAVAERVLFLLNQDLSGNNFGPLPATPFTAPTPPDEQHPKDKFPFSHWGVENDKIKIVSPLAGTVLTVDQPLQLGVSLLDTSGYLYMHLLFQGKLYSTNQAVPLINFNIQVGGNLLEQQSIIAIAYYQVSGGGVEQHVDEISVRVTTQELISAFEAHPLLHLIQKGDTTRPVYTATFQTFQGQLGNSAGLTAELENPQIVYYNQADNSFIGLDTGSTYAIVSYKGLKDTTFFLVIAEPDLVSTTQYPVRPANSSITRSMALSVSPNPSSAFFNITLTSRYANTVTLDVLDCYGRVVRTISSGKISEGAMQYALDLSDVSDGIYFLRAHDANAVVSCRIVKTRS